MECMSTEFGVAAQVVFLLQCGHTDRQTDRHTKSRMPLITLPTHPLLRGEVKFMS